MRKHYRKTWGQIASNTFGVTICPGPAGCRKKWSAYVHNIGRVDTMGYLHWKGRDHRSHEDFLYKFMIWMAFCLNPSFREEERWLGIVHAGTWANRHAREDLGIRLTYEPSVKYRELAHELFRQSKSRKVDHHVAYNWMIYRKRS